MHLPKILLREPKPASALLVESVDLLHAPRSEQTRCEQSRLDQARWAQSRGEQTRGQVSAFWLKALSVLALLLCFQVDAKLNGQEPAIEKVSQIQLLPGPLPMHAGRVMPLLFSGQLEPAAGAITAGELWSFFSKQGLTEVQSIILFLDVEKFSGPVPIHIQTIEFRIEPSDSTKPLTHCALEDSKDLIIPGDDSLAAASEARLEIPLEYDFMKRFHAGSEERVFLKLTYQAPQGSEPNFFVAGRQEWFSLPSLSLLLGFVGFWSVVFLALFRLTLKSTAAASSMNRVS